MLLRQEDAYLVGIAECARSTPHASDEAVLLVDEGRQFFELRAIALRGRVNPVQAPAGVPGGLRWYELIPARTIAWDFGALRLVSDDS